MLSRSDLLKLAEEFAERIPRTRDYALDWNTAWRAIASAYLCLDDMQSAQRAVSNLEDLCMQAPVRVEAALWAGRHPDSATGRDLLVDTVARASTFESWWSRRDVTDLVPVIASMLGIEHVEALARQLDDPFTAGNVYVTLAGCLTDPAAKREQFQKAETLAATVRQGDRDFALRWVFEGYRQAGLMADADRVRRLATEDPEDLTKNERRILADAKTAIAQADTIVRQDAAGTLGDRLRRFMEYGFNDLKVVFLADASRIGDLDSREIESRVRSQEFQRIGPPRAPWLKSDVTSLGAHGLAHLLFARPVCQHDDDRALLEGDDWCAQDCDDAAFVRAVTELFEDFGRLASSFSREQVEQGLWFVLGQPFWLSDALVDRNIPIDSRHQCVRAMFHPFRDYYLPLDAPLSEDVFFMWWDLSLTRVGDHGSDIDAVAVDVIGQILQLPSKQCQFAALHGLNHLYRNEVAAQLARGYLQAHRASLTADEIAWAEACASGQAL